jgi:hypothetical protein
MLADFFLATPLSPQPCEYLVFNFIVNPDSRLQGLLKNQLQWTLHQTSTFKSTLSQLALTLQLMATMEVSHTLLCSAALNTWPRNKFAHLYVFPHGISGCFTFHGTS